MLRTPIAALLLVLALVLTFLPLVGHGFVKDDFAWIRHGKVGSVAELGRLFTEDNGFYRPLVGASFAANHALFGLDPFPYGATNLLLLLLAAGALAALARSLGLSPGAALAAGALWAFSHHGPPMAVLWISGRTALLLTVFALLAARSFVAGRVVWASGLTLAAMLSKEEAVVLPAILTVWAGLDGPGPGRFDWRAALARGGPMLAAWLPYAWLRSRTGAYLPHDAPGFYRYSTDPGLVLTNVLEYADRSLTFPAAALALAWLVVRRRPALEVVHRRCFSHGAVWLALGFAPTLLIPVRSSLYACFPAAGAALAAAALSEALWRVAAPHARSVLVWGALLVAFGLMPLHRSRSARWVVPAELSRAVLEELRARPVGPGVWTVLEDDPGRRFNLAAAFGTLMPDAVGLAADAPRRVWIEPPPPDWAAAGLAPPPPGEPVLWLSLRDGRLAAGPAR